LPRRRVLTDASEDAMVRHEAAEALGAIGDERAVALLAAHAADAEPIVADSCVVALDMLAHERSGAFQYADVGEEPGLGLEPGLRLEPGPEPGPAAGARGAAVEARGFAAQAAGDGAPSGHGAGLRGAQRSTASVLHDASCAASRGAGRCGAPGTATDAQRCEAVSL